MVVEASIMKSEKQELKSAYLLKIKSANKEYTKKEIFKDLLNRLYSGIRKLYQ